MNKIADGRRSRRRHPLTLIGVGSLLAAVVIIVVVWLTPNDEQEFGTHRESAHDASGNSQVFQPPPVLAPAAPTNFDRSGSTTPNVPGGMTGFVLPAEPQGIQVKPLMEEMIVEAKRLQAAYPRNAAALDLAASVYYDLNHLDEAERVWTKCVALHPNRAGIYVGFAQMLVTYGKPELAVTILEQAHAQGIETAESHLGLADAFASAGELESAAKTAAEVTSRFPQLGNSWFLLGRAESQLGKPAEAEEHLRQALQSEHPESQVLPVLIAVLYRQGKREEADALRERLDAIKAESAPENTQSFQSKYEASLRDHASSSFIKAAFVEHESRNTREVERLLTRGLQLNPADTIALTLMADLLVGQQRLRDALVVYKKLIGLQDDNAVLFSNMASLAFQLRDIDLAESVLTQAVSTHPEADDLLIMLAKVQLSRGRAVAAQKLTQQVVSRSHNPAAYVVLAEAYQASGDLQAAKDATAMARLHAVGPR